MTMLRPLTMLTVAWLCVAAFAGCNRRPDTALHPFSWQRLPAVNDVRRIVIIPIDRSGANGRSSQGLDTALADSLRDIAQHVVIEADPKDLPSSLTGAVLSDRIRADDLLALRDHYHADAVMIGRLHHFNGYDPISAGLTLHLVSCMDGSVLWSASGSFDGSRDTVQKDIAAWYRRRQADRGNTVQTWQTVLHTPSLFSRYIGDRLFVTLAEAR